MSGWWREQRRESGVGLGEVLEFVQNNCAALVRETLDNDQGGGPGSQRLRAQQRVVGGLGEDAREVAELVGGRPGGRLEEQPAPAFDKARQELCLADPAAPPNDQELRGALCPAGLEQGELFATVEEVHERNLQENCVYNKSSCAQSSCRRLWRGFSCALVRHAQGRARACLRRARGARDRHPPFGV